MRGYLELCQIKDSVAWRWASTCGVAFLRQGTSGFCGVQAWLHEAGCQLLGCLQAFWTLSCGCCICLG